MNPAFGIPPHSTNWSTIKSKLGVSMILLTCNGGGGSSSLVSSLEQKIVRYLPAVNWFGKIVKSVNLDMWIGDFSERFSKYCLI